MIRILIISCILFSGLFSQDAADIKKKIIESGLSETQIRQMAKQRGMSDAEIDAKAKEIKGETSGGGDAPMPSIEDVPETGLDDVSMELIEEDNEDGEVEQETMAQPGKKALAYFGYDIFKRDPALFQASVFGAVDPNYNIGPGDEIIIMLWGETQFRQVLSVDREGFIFIPEVGQVFVNGLSMDLLESKMFNVLSQRYSSLVRSNSGNATTFLDISLGNLRPLRILVVGEVAQPGAFRVSPSTTLFSSLYYFNGPTTLGSLRDVQLIRGGKQIATIDFYDYLLSGKKQTDVRLQLDDTIFLPPRGKTVSIQGEINRPAIYELIDGEGLLDVVKLAGNLKVSAYLDRIQIDRIVPFNERESLGMDRMYIDVNIKELIDSANNYELLDGDVIQIFPIMDLRKNYVEIRGNVERQGSYEIEDGMRISDLIELAEGLISDVYLDLAHLVRINENLTEDLFEIDLSAALDGDENENMELQPFDAVLIYNKNTLFNAFKTVEINGSVKRPGRYPFFEGMTMNDLLIHAGGFNKNVYRVKLEVMRVDPHDPHASQLGQMLTLPHFFTIDDFGNNFHNDELGTLQAHDVVFVRADADFKLNHRVRITGGVFYPGEYAILKTNEFVSDIIERAGGFNEDAYPEASTLTRNNVDINIDLNKIMKSSGSNIDFQILAGDEIYINKHPNLVYVNGEVNNPGALKFIPGQSMRDYIRKAGGYTSDADKRDVWIRYASGNGKEFNRYSPFSPVVKDGSVITVDRETREEIDKTELAKEITAILASMAQVIAIIILAQP